MNIYTFHPKVVIRTPRFALDSNISEAILKSELQKSDFLEAIYLASPHLFEASIKWLKGYLFSEKDKEKLLFSLSKYYLRSRSRCTPFGLFSGISVVNWLDVTSVKLGCNVKRHTRLDMNYVCALAQFLSQLDFIKEKLLFYPNNSSYTLNHELRYVEYYFHKSKKSHQITAIKDSKYLRKILKKAGKKGAKLNELIACLIDSQISEAEAREFVEELIEIQILTNQLEPTITGDEYFIQLIALLEELNSEKSPELSEIIRILKEIHFKISELDISIINQNSDYAYIINLIRLLGVDFDEATLFQTDMELDIDEGSGISKTIQSDILKALEVLKMLNKGSKLSNLDNFIGRFFERYEEEEVPLLLALDTETGIGYLNENQNDYTPLLEGIDFFDNKIEQLNLETNQIKILKKLNEVLALGINVLDLNDIQFANYEKSKKTLPPSFSALFRVLNGNSILLETISGSGAANLLGRFAHTKPEIKDIISDICEKEQIHNGDIIFAEIVHLPENRTGNILLHPVFRVYEIPYLAKASVDIANQINVNDLVISVKNGELILRSKTLNKIIIPRLSNAHNYTNDALPIYQFLCDLQNQGLYQNLSFNWGDIIESYTYLPRVKIGNVVVSAAVWNFKKDEYSAVKDLNSFYIFSQKYRLPAQFVLVEGDNELLIDSSCQMAIELFINAIRNHPALTLKEFLNISDTNIIDHNNQPVANQFIANILANEPIYNNKNIVSNKQKIQRKFIFGSEWVYYKVYCGAKSADNILLYSLVPVLKKAFKENIIDSWFFIRYNDPENHLRLRFHLVDVAKLNELVFLINNSIVDLVDNKTIWKIQTDTYNRELERYGFHSIQLNELFFNKSSNALIEFLEVTSGDTREQSRWLFAMKSIDVIFDLFGYNLKRRFELTDKLCNSFKEEFSINKTQRIVIDEKFRNNRELIFQFMNNQIPEFETIYLNFYQDSRKIVETILENSYYKNSCYNVDYLVSSQIHMHINRLISSNQRQHELMIYSFLIKYYQSIIARNK